MRKPLYPLKSALTLTTILSGLSLLSEYVLPSAGKMEKSLCLLPPRFLLGPKARGCLPIVVLLGCYFTHCSDSATKKSLDSQSVMAGSAGPAWQLISVCLSGRQWRWVQKQEGGRPHTQMHLLCVADWKALRLLLRCIEIVLGRETRKWLTWINVNI